MTIAIASLPRRTPAQLRTFAHAQHVEVERHPDDVGPSSASDETYWRYLLSRIPLEGVCVYYQTYDASGDENDWNLNIAPGHGYEWLLDPGILQALSLFSGAPSLMEPCSVKCKEGYQVIEAELTPDDGLYDMFVTDGLPISEGSWWPNKDENQGEGPTGDRVGVYGVFCGDYGHGGRPEIHPFDGFWRQRHRDGRASSISWDLGVFQDDSNRFNGDWSRAPIDVEFRIPFCLDVPVTLRAATTTRARFVLARSDLCSVIAKNTRAAGASDLSETFAARTVRLNPGLRNRLVVSVQDATGLAGRPFSLAFDDLTYTTTSRLGPLGMRAWLAGRIVVRVAVDQDGFAYWNFSGPNSATAASAEDDRRRVEDPVVAGRDIAPTLARQRPELPERTSRVHVVDATPRVSLGRSPSLSVEVGIERTAPQGGRKDLGRMTVRPGEIPWLFDEDTESWTELESFDLFATAAVSRVGVTRRTQADIADAIGRLAGLEHLGQRLQAPAATIELDDALMVTVATRYAPYRDGEVMGEERSLVSESLSKFDTGPVTARCDVWLTDSSGRARRVRIGDPDEPAVDGAGVTVETVEGGQRLVVGAIGAGPMLVRVEGHVQDSFDRRANVFALAANFRVLDARRWVDGASGVPLEFLQARLAQAAGAARLSPTPGGVAATGMWRSISDLLLSLNSDEPVPATRVAGAVRLARRVDELLLRPSRPSVGLKR